MSRLGSVIARALVLAAIAGPAVLPTTARSDPASFALDVVLKHRDGTYVEGGRVEVIGPERADAPPFVFRGEATTDAKGRASFRLPAAGPYRVEALASGHRSFSGVASVKDASFSLTYEAILRQMEVFAIDVKAETADGSFVEGARVRVEAADVRSGTKPPSIDATTDAKGVAHFQVGESGVWSVSVVHPRFEPGSMNLTTVDAFVRATCTFSLRAKAAPGDGDRLPLRIVAADDGSPVDGADVEAVAGERVSRVRSDRRGVALLPAATGVTLRVRIVKEGFTPRLLTVTPLPGGEPRTPVDVPIERRPVAPDRELVGSVSCEPDRPAPGDEVRIVVRLRAMSADSPALDVEQELDVVGPNGASLARAHEARKVVGDDTVRTTAIRSTETGRYAVRVHVVGPGVAAWIGTAQFEIREPGDAERGGPGRPPSTRTSAVGGPGTGGAAPGTGSEGAPPTPPAEAPADFAGRWRHVSGTTIELAQSGASVTGTWSHLASRVVGTVRGHVLEFTTTSPDGLACAGSVTLDASGAAFFGDARVTQSATDAGRHFHFDAERLPGK